MPDRPSLDVVIVDWNAGPVVTACVESVMGARRYGFRLAHVIVVDNASTDGSRAGLGRIAPEVFVHRNDANRGFAAACNQGAAGSRADYLLFLNPDTSVAIDALETAIAFMESPGRADVAVCGGAVVDSDGRCTPSSRRFPTLRIVAGQLTGANRVWPALFPPLVYRPAEAAKPAVVEQVLGAFFLVRRPVFEALGGFDERFFVYYEEVDFCYRARAAGHRTAYLPAVSYFHHGGYSTAQARSARLVNVLRSRILYAAKHWNPAATVVLIGCTATVELAARVLVALVRGAPRELGATLRAYIGLFGWGLGVATARNGAVRRR